MENLKRIKHDCMVGDKVLMRDKSANKMEMPWKGPFKITQVWGNGTVTLRMGAVQTRVNMRWITPYRERSAG